MTKRRPGTRQISTKTTTALQNRNHKEVTKEVSSSTLPDKDRREEESRKAGKKQQKRKAAAAGREPAVLSDPKKIQALIPYSCIYPEQGMFCTKGTEKHGPDLYSVAYRISPADPDCAVDTGEAQIQAAMTAFLNGLSQFEDLKIQFFIINSRTPLSQFLEQTILPDEGKSAGLKNAVSLINALIQENAPYGHNNMKKDRFFLISAAKNSPEEAAAYFREAEKAAAELFAGICGIRIERLSAPERLHLLRTVYHMDETEDPTDYTAYLHPKSGVSSKAAVMPASLQEGKNLICLDRTRYCRLFMINNFPSDLSSYLIPELTSTSSTMVYTALYEPLDPALGAEVVCRAVESNTVSVERTQTLTLAQKKGGCIPVQTERKETSEEAYFLEEARELFRSAGKDGSLWLGSFLVALFADTKEELQSETRMLATAAVRFSFQIKTLDYQQMNALKSILPLGQMFVDIKRTFTGERLSRLNPLEIKTQNLNHGALTGVNAITDNLLFTDRRQHLRPAGLISGIRSSGKTFQAKLEILNILSRTEDSVYILSYPGKQEKYSGFAAKLGGKILPEAPGGIFEQFRYSPENRELDQDFLVMLVMNQIRTRFSLSPDMLAKARKNVEQETAVLIGKQPADIRQAIRLLQERRDSVLKRILELFFDFPGASNAFMEFSGTLNLLTADGTDALMRCLNAVSHQVLEDSKKGRCSWIYIDQADSLLMSAEGVKYLKNLLRKMNRTKNPVTLLIDNIVPFSSGALRCHMDELWGNEADAVIGCYRILSQEPAGRQVFAEALHLQSSLLPYITNTASGKGLLVSESRTVPFTSDLKEIADSDTALSFLKILE